MLSLPSLFFSIMFSLLFQRSCLEFFSIDFFSFKFLGFFIVSFSFFFPYFFCLFVFGCLFSSRVTFPVILSSHLCPSVLSFAVFSSVVSFFLQLFLPFAFFSVVSILFILSFSCHCFSVFPLVYFTFFCFPFFSLCFFLFLFFQFFPFWLPLLSFLFPFGFRTLSSIMRVVRVISFCCCCQGEAVAVCR